MSRDDLAYLFHVSLDKLAFLPFAYVMDQWRWNLFTGALAEQDINTEWWRLREKLQGKEIKETTETSRGSTIGQMFRCESSCPDIGERFPPGGQVSHPS